MCKHYITQTNSQLPIFSNRSYIKTISLLCALFASSAVHSGIYDGLLAYYNFDDCTARDVSNNGRDGTLKNAVTCVNGKVNKALHIQGSGWLDTDPKGGYITLPMINFSKINNYSICIWVKEQGMTAADGEAYINFGTAPLIGHPWDTLEFTNAGKDYDNNTNTKKYPFRAQDMKNFTHYCLTYQNDTQEVKHYRNADFIGKLIYKTGEVYSPFPIALYTTPLM